VRIAATDDLPGALDEVGKIFTRHNPAYPFDYYFADVQFERKFSTFNLIGSLSKIFTVLSLIITGLGLFGLASFAAEQRSKEISIRKVMGASVSGLVMLITRDFSRLVGIAFLVAGPVGWYLMNQFLERYPYRVELSIWILPATGLAALFLAVMVVSALAFRAATANPAHMLRSE